MAQAGWEMYHNNAMEFSIQDYTGHIVLVNQRAGVMSK